ncbi:hypothetical protein HZ326_9366 [Fusarium oxysporum f. sp. albedinis]|nr:hypothetical protein HZ326_9366 [Fusarium oxysporum f. sp. albedinis]
MFKMFLESCDGAERVICRRTAVLNHRSFAHFGGCFAFTVPIYFGQDIYRCNNHPKYREHSHTIWRPP